MRKMNLKPLEPKTYDEDEETGLPVIEQCMVCQVKDVPGAVELVYCWGELDDRFEYCLPCSQEGPR